MTPQVAIVIPTKDRQEALERAVRSVLGQSFREWELWIVDDGSQPSVQLGSEAASDPRVNLVRNESSKGPSAGRNLGVDRSSAPLLAFLDDDDEWLPDKLAVQVATLEMDESVAAVECGYDMYDGERHVFRFEPLDDRDHYNVLLRRPCLQASTLMLRRAAFDDIGGFDESLTRTEDWVFALDLTQRHSISTVSAPLVRRSLSDPPPLTMLDGYLQFVARLRERVADMPDQERLKLFAFHDVITATYMLESGDVAGARAKLRSAWKTDPRSWRANAHLARSYLGESSWRRARSSGYAVARRVGAFKDKEPIVVRRW